MLEIERKFLVRSTNWGPPRSSQPMAQGYIFIGPDRTMRVRRICERYILTLKVGAGGLARYEIEWDATPLDGRQILEQLCIGGVVTKTRHVVEHAGKIWEIDVFDGANSGLIVAEIELADESETFEKPGWLGPEVTDDGRFYNASLSTAPFEDWGVSYDALLAEKSS